MTRAARFGMVLACACGRLEPESVPTPDAAPDVVIDASASVDAALGDVADAIGVSSLGYAKQISVGAHHVCAVTLEGAAYCWGYGYDGELGDGTPHSTPSVVPVAVSGLASGVVSVSAANGYTCAVTSAGTALCWGQFPQPNSSAQSAPVVVPGFESGVTMVSAGEDHMCVLESDGGVWCWGRNESGQLGDGTTNDSATPVAVVGLQAPAVAVSAGELHTCALTSAGDVLCWGWNGDAWIGNGSWSDAHVPTKVLALGNSHSISATNGGSCAVTTNGGALCWGVNTDGQLGDGTTNPALAAVGVSGLAVGVGAISTGHRHSCAATTSGQALCWGYGWAGELGDGTEGDSLVPVAVSLSNVTDVSAGDLVSCAVTANGRAFCWGDNQFGQLGNGTTTSSDLPVAVLGFP